MTTMKALRCHELIGPAGLVWEDVPCPEPGEVCIDVRAAGVNFPELLITAGKYQLQPQPPFIPGGEVSGIVRSVGSPGGDLTPGQRVVATMLFGAYAEQVAVPREAVLPLPDEVDFHAAAAFPITYATGYHALVNRGNLAKGETLLVLGAAGGVGTAAIELGKLLGARVIAAASTEEKVAFCIERGADAGIVTSREDLKERAKALSNGGVDVIYDPVGGDLSEAALRAIAPGGRFLVIGFASGVIPKLALNLTLLKEASVIGVFWGAFAMRERRTQTENMKTLLGWLATGQLRPHIDRVLPMSEGRAALEALARREVRGKILLET